MLHRSTDTCLPPSAMLICLHAFSKHNQPLAAAECVCVQSSELHSRHELAIWIGYCVMRRQLVNCLQATTTKSRQRQSTCRRGVHTGALKLPLWEQKVSLSSKLFKARLAELLSTSMSKSTEPSFNQLCQIVFACQPLFVAVPLLVLAGICSFGVA